MLRDFLQNVQAKNEEKKLRQAAARTILDSLQEMQVYMRSLQVLAQNPMQCMSFPQVDFCNLCAKILEGFTANLINSPQKVQKQVGAFKPKLVRIENWVRVCVTRDDLLPDTLHEARFTTFTTDLLALIETLKKLTK